MAYMNKGRSTRVRINSRGIAVICALLVIIVLIVIGVGSCIAGIHNDKKDTDDEETTPSTVSVVPTDVSSTEPSTTLIETDLLYGLYSTNALLMDAEDGSVIQEINGYERSYPASVTKIMTALVFLENVDDLDQTVTMTSDIYDALYYQDLASAGFEKDEVVPLQDLLYGAMLKSGAECCLAMANYVAGSESAFVELMNQKADELGLQDTHFMNTTGAHNADHYSSCYDMAVIMREGLKNDTFREVISTEEYAVPASETHPEGLFFFNNFFLGLYTNEAGGATLLGGKTGYTSEAGQCLASYCEINGHEYILVTFGAFMPENSEGVNTSNLHTADARTVYERLAEYINGN